MHADMSADAIAETARLVRGLPYDLCVLTGDYRERAYGPFQPCLRNMIGLRDALRGDIYGILGNHDTIPMVPDLERIGIQILLNEHVMIERAGCSIFLGGIDDAHFYRVDNIEKAAAEMHRDAISILLSHTPEIYRQASHAGFDLLLAGHTRGADLSAGRNANHFTISSAAVHGQRTVEVSRDGGIHISRRRIVRRLRPFQLSARDNAASPETDRGIASRIASSDATEQATGVHGPRTCLRRSRRFVSAVPYARAC
jgi:hypothetical protein